jgi:hypothetical protein
MSPQQKQQFYPVTTETIIDQNDFLISKCTYDTSSKENVTFTGLILINYFLSLIFIFYSKIS